MRTGIIFYDPRNKRKKLSKIEHQLAQYLMPRWAFMHLLATNMQLEKWHKTFLAFCYSKQTQTKAKHMVNILNNVFAWPLCMLLKHFKPRVFVQSKNMRISINFWIHNSVESLFLLTLTSCDPSNGLALLFTTPGTWGKNYQKLNTNWLIIWCLGGRLCTS